LTDGPLLVAVPNISEGQRPDLVRAIAGTSPALLDVHSDADHNRSVLTYAGTTVQLVSECGAMIDRAVASLDIRHQTGAHPRFGVVDVLPIVPHRGGGDDAFAAAAGLAAHAQARGLPVHRYGFSGPPLPELRRMLRTQTHDTHPSAGVICIGVRDALIAFNVNLRTDMATARALARDVRTLPGVRALAFELPSRELVQVSMNLTDPATAGPRAAYEHIAVRAADAIVDAEIVGLVPYELDLTAIPLRAHPRTIEAVLNASRRS